MSYVLLQIPRQPPHRGARNVAAGSLRRAGMFRREWRLDVPGSREEAFLAEKQQLPQCESFPQCLIDVKTLPEGSRLTDIHNQAKCQSPDNRQHPSACCPKPTILFDITFGCGPSLTRIPIPTRPSQTLDG